MNERFAELNRKVEDLKVIVESLKMRKNRSNQNREIVCWSCKKKGHVRANYPDSQNTNTVNTDTSRASSSEN